MTDCSGNNIERIIAHVRKLCRNTRYEGLSEKAPEIVLTSNNDLQLELDTITFSGKEGHLFVNPRKMYAIFESATEMRHIEIIKYNGFKELLSLNNKIDKNWSHIWN